MKVVVEEEVEVEEGEVEMEKEVEEKVGGGATIINLT